MRYGARVPVHIAPVLLRRQSLLVPAHLRRAALAHSPACSAADDPGSRTRSERHRCLGLARKRITGPSTPPGATAARHATEIQTPEARTPKSCRCSQCRGAASAALRTCAWLRLRLNPQSEELVDARWPQQNPCKWRKRSVDLIRGREIINDLRLVRGVVYSAQFDPTSACFQHVATPVRGGPEGHDSAECG